MNRINPDKKAVSKRTPAFRTEMAEIQVQLKNQEVVRPVCRLIYLISDLAFITNRFTRIIESLSGQKTCSESERTDSLTRNDGAEYRLEKPYKKRKSWYVIRAKDFCHSSMDSCLYRT